MKLREIIFNAPVQLLQVYRNINVYGKMQRSLDDRKDRLHWKAMQSVSGYVSNGVLYLPEAIQDDPGFMQCQLITMEDNNTAAAGGTGDLPHSNVAAPGDAPVYNHCIRLSPTALLDIFKLRKQDQLEIFLQYGYFEVGTPARENYKIGNIEKGKPVEIKINGKTDFSLTSRRDRVFKEQYYIYDYIGDFDRCYLLKEPIVPVIKQVPANRKVIDLLKQLW